MFGQDATLLRIPCLTLRGGACERRLKGEIDAG